jgi:superfamily II DNA or RNA helicase
VLVAHRSEHISQSAQAHNREREPHSIIGPKSLITETIKLQHDTHGYSTFAWRAPIRVAGVDTLIKTAPTERWLQQIALVVIDEAHHVAGGNKWMRATALMPAARVLGVTAHALRADGQGLGRHADGIFDRLVVGPHARELIERGFLTDYRLLIPPNDVDFSGVAIGSTGEYSAPQLRAATHRSKQLVGDVVKHYVREAGGKLGLTFAVDLESANELCVAYRKAGVPTEIISGGTSIAARSQIMRAFRERRILQLVSVDVLGEGTDVPAVEVISLARRTASFQLLSQQIGRALRVSVDDAWHATWGDLTDTERRRVIFESDKPKALILDHVGNVLLHYERRGLPDSRQEYTLDRRAARVREPAADVIPLRSCLTCFQVYERFRDACPHCGAGIPPPAGRGSPEQVDGDLRELDPEVLAALRAEVARVDAPARIPANVDGIVGRAITKRHNERAAAQRTLRARMALWAGWYKLVGLSDPEIQRLFWHTFHTDPLTASAANAQDATTLQARIDAQIERLNIVEEPHE